MRPLHRSIGAAVLLLGAPLLAAAACGPPPPPEPPTGGTADPTATGAPTGDPTAVPTGTGTASPTPCHSSDPGCDSPPPVFECRLPQPKKSDDACQTDADCGVSEPCHAHACVAKAKSNPPGAGTICTRLMDCASVDANPCACFEGVCALVPRPR